MRFDAARALAEAENFAFDRLPWTEGGRRAVGRVAEAFREAGYTIEKTEVSGSPATRNLVIALPILCLGFGLSAALMLHAPGEHLGLRCGRLALCCGGAFGLLFLANLGGIFGSKRVRTWNIVARRSDQVETPGRIVVATALDVSASVPRTCGRRMAIWVFRAAVLTVVVLALAPGQLSTLVRFVSIATFGIVCAAWIVFRVRPFPGEEGDDNRDGLGFLVELARTWPPAMFGRVELRFAAVGGQILDRAGLRELSRSLNVEAEFDRKPTLVVAIWSPGRSSRLRIVAESELAEFTLAAANSLWIPCERERDMTVIRELCPDSPQIASLGLIGVSSHPTASPLDRQALGRAAQLVHELALRWSKLAGQASRETAARSSQNRG